MKINTPVEKKQPVVIVITRYANNTIYFNNGRNAISLQDLLNAIMCYAEDPYEDIKCRDVYSLSGKPIIIMALVNEKDCVMTFTYTGTIAMTPAEMAFAVKIPEGVLVP